MDVTFARLVAQSAQGDPSARGTLLEHPGLGAIVRHRKLSGRDDIDREALIDRILANVPDAAKIGPVLEAWEGRDSELSQFAAEALALLPRTALLEPTLFFVAGYDIGFAAPPDVAVNAAHPRFVEDPEEIGPYVTHEIHHVGFIEQVGYPPLEGLQDPAALRRLIWFMAHMEGMAIHAAYLPRKKADRLAADEDYRVYTDPRFVSGLRKRFGEVYASIPDEAPVASDQIGRVLGAMSSGERLWYRFGAHACRMFEHEFGRERLIATLERPAANSALHGQADEFSQYARSLL